MQVHHKRQLLPHFPIQSVHRKAVRSVRCRKTFLLYTDLFIFCFGKHAHSAWQTKLIN